MVQCSQCGNNAFVRVKNHVLCLRCYATWQQILRQSHFQRVAQPDRAR